MTSFILKIIAIISMLIDHIGIAYFKQTTFVNVIGRIAFPIFAFQISEGYQHTKNLKKYFFRLVLFALISQIPFMLFKSIYTDNFGLNIFFTLLFGLLAILVYDKICASTFYFSKKNLINLTIKHCFAIFIAILIGVLAEVCKFDYGFFGIAIIVLFYIFRNHKVYMILSFILACLIKYGMYILLHAYHYLYILLCLFTILSSFFICIYNKKQGRKIKYLLYVFYPLHLLILYLIFGILI